MQKLQTVRFFAGKVLLSKKELQNYVLLMKAMNEGQRFSPWRQFQLNSPLNQLALLLMLTGVGFILAGVVDGLIQQVWISLHGGHTAKTKDEVLKNVELSRLLQIAGTFVFFVIPAWLFTYITKGRPTAKYLGFTAAISGKQMFTVVIMFMGAFFVSSALEEINQAIPLSKGLEATFKRMEDEYNKEAETLGTIRTGGEYFIAIIMLALLPAIAEEMLFRGCLQKVMIGLARHVAVGIIITSILFSLMHGSYYGFLVRVFLGIMLGYIYYYGKNIWLNITMHFLNNAFVITQMYSISKNGGISAADEQAAKNIPIMSIIFVGAAATVGIVYLFKTFKQESEFVISMHRLDEIDNGDEPQNLL